MWSKITILVRALIGLSPVAAEVIEAVKENKAKQKSNKWLFGTMLVFASFCLIAALVLSVEKIHLLENPNAQLSCNFNVLFNCATVMQTPQASVLGFPNSFIGLIFFPVVITIAVLGLFRVKFPKLFMRLAEIGFLLGTLFAYWLFFQSVYVIEILCPWCLVVTFSTTIFTAALTRYNLRENVFDLPGDLHNKVLAFLKKDYDKLIVASWLVLLVVLVYIKFGNALFGGI